MDGSTARSRRTDVIPTEYRRDTDAPFVPDAPCFKGIVVCPLHIDTDPRPLQQDFINLPLAPEIFLARLDLMLTRVALFSLLVPDYDQALAFFTAIGFETREDTDLGGGKRWVRIAPPRADTEILLARAANQTQRDTIGNQGGGRVWLFLETQDFDADHALLTAAGAVFEASPRNEPYGRVAVWRDPFGNRWDLIQYTHADRSGTAATSGR